MIFAASTSRSTNCCERATWCRLHVPLTPETRGLIKKQTIEKMKFGAMLINTSRGALVDARAAIDALYEE